jgi:hypothetical protein
MVFANFAVVTLEGLMSQVSQTQLHFTNMKACDPQLRCDALVSEVKSNVPFGKQNGFTPDPSQSAL